ncbi:uncharacterized protein LOC120157277 [Hibiscus syriacus]|uniref:uncharacterized protein LOC120157277 n=1 Tax=Hibiscus syriacus TaxID=106335 RepID=UPI001922C802|nr:uncharacterized protein LOC120157277 [Hibiscus syriacus]
MIKYLTVVATAGERMTISPPLPVKAIVPPLSGERGIRQGDPLSPILFVLAMNILSRLLNTAAAKGNLESVTGVIIVLNHFYDMSGLKLNVAKNELFAVGISLRNLENIKNSTGFNYGYLPVRYLGVPLVTRKLTENDCSTLIDKIKSRLHQWSGKHLGYAGRLELIKTVLLSIANFWCRQFLLPQTVINRINQLCSRFLWKGFDTSTTCARVSWDKICCPKIEGGLGLKDLKSWNKAYMMKLIKNLLAGEGSLWIAWIYSYVIKTKDFRVMTGGASFSWCFNRLLKLKTEALPILNAGATNTKDIWEKIGVKRDKVSLHKLIWFPLHIPKFIIISWMTILDRLPSRERLTRIGIAYDGSCILCNEAL